MMAPALFSKTGATWQTACKPNSVEDGHSSRRRIAARAPATYPEVSAMHELASSHVTRVGAPGRHASAADRAGLRISSLFGLAPCGVYPASVVTAGAVRSYRTFSPLPSPLTRRGRYLLCGTSRLTALKPRSRTLSGTLPCGVRTFLSRLGLRLTGSGRPACLHSSYVSSVWLGQAL